jgi:Trk-type K+ transport system membrane component
MLMIQSSYTLATLIAITTITFLLMFLPAIIELKKPKDAGPRLINDNIAKIRISTLKIPITNIEEEQKFDSQSTINIASFIYLIPNLEV